MMLAFTDSSDGYYEFPDDSPPAWYAGLTPTAIRPPQINSVPQSVTRFQALAALHLAGHLPAVEAIMAAPETPVLAKLAWANALSFERSSPLLNGLAGTLGLTSQDLDDLFTAAAGIAA